MKKLKTKKVQAEENTVRNKKPYLPPAVLFSTPLTVECYVCEGGAAMRFKQHPKTCRRFES